MPRRQSRIEMHLARPAVRFLGAAICLILPAVVVSCSLPPSRPDVVTPMDLKSQNMEKIRQRLPLLLGNDSAGRAAMDYVAWFETQLAEYLPKCNAPIGRKREPEAGSLAQEKLAVLYAAHLQSTFQPPLETNELLQRPENQAWIAFAKKTLEESRMKMGACADLFASSRNIGDAKTAFAAGYVALSLSSGPATEEIGRTMSHLLDSLTAHGQ